MAAADVLFWSDLQQRLDGVFVGQQAMSTGDYMGISLAVSRHVHRAEAEEVRQWVSAYVNGHLAGVGRRLQQTERGAPLIAAYVSQWLHFAQASQAVSSSLGRTVGSGMREVMVQAWYTAVFRRVEMGLATAAVALVDDARSGGSAGDPQPLTTLHAALADLRPTLAPELQLPRGSGSSLRVYSSWYLEPYAWAAVRYVDSCTRHLRAQGSTREYIRLVSRLMEEEDRRAAAYLRLESVELLKCVLAQRFVAARLANIHAEASSILAAAANDEGGNDDDLRTVFCLLRRVPADSVAMQPLRKTFEAHVSQQILAALPKRAERFDSNDSSSSAMSLAFSRDAVDWLLSELTRYRNIVKQCFDGDSGFSASLVAGLQRALNSDSLFGPNYPQLRAPLLLARYFGFLLQTDSALSLELTAANPAGFENAVEACARDALQLCEYIKDKDKLMGHYLSLLARRLVTESSVSADLERSVVAMLAPVVVFYNNVQIKAMLADMTTSEDLSALYKDVRSPASLDATFKVLTSAAWSQSLASECLPVLAVPTQISAACDRLANLYNARYSNPLHGGSNSSGRKLQWQWAYSKATIQMFFPNSVGRTAISGYTLVVNAYQLAILVLFTDSSCLGYASQQLTPVEISYSIKLDLTVVGAELAVLERAGILVRVKNGGNAVMINPSFNSRRMRIDISGIKRMRQQTADEIKTIDCVAEEHRRMQIQSVVVPLLKRHSVMHHKALFDAVTRHFERLFLVKNLAFKLAIDNLIDREFIRRKDDDNRVYEFLTK
ncbi:hypothetical protein GGF42_002207 [Coemansia sp. RSA 2424]|nr:hypothetical protein GGF42_002207 [Coemansia sp. RSA 2424]